MVCVLFDQTVNVQNEHYIYIIGILKQNTTIVSALSREHVECTNQTLHIYYRNIKQHTAIARDNI